MALGDTATTGCPASRRRSTSRPSGRSIATVSPPGSPSARRRATSLSNPSAECSTMNDASALPASSLTATACSVDAQSIPANNTFPVTSLVSPLTDASVKRARCRVVTE